MLRTRGRSHQIATLSVTQASFERTVTPEHLCKPSSSTSLHIASDTSFNIDTDWYRSILEILNFLEGEKVRMHQSFKIRAFQKTGFMTVDPDLGPLRSYITAIGCNARDVFDVIPVYRESFGPGKAEFRTWLGSSAPTAYVVMSDARISETFLGRGLWSTPTMSLSRTMLSEVSSLDQPGSNHALSELQTWELQQHAITALHNCWPETSSLPKPSEDQYSLGEVTVPKGVVAVRVRRQASGLEILGYLPVHYYHLVRLLIFQRNVFNEALAYLARHRERASRRLQAWKVDVTLQLAQRVSFMQSILSKACETEHGPKKPKSPLPPSTRVDVIDAWAAQLRGSSGIIGMYGPGFWLDASVLKSLGDPLGYSEYILVVIRALRSYSLIC